MVEWSAVPSASGKSKKTSGWVSFVWLMIDKWTSLQDARLARQVIFTQPEHTMDEDTPYALKDYAEKQRRLGLLDSQQNKPLRDYVETMRLERGAAYHIPYFDPCDGGISAQILFLLEAPGGKAVGSGFISRNNPDPTAKNMCELLYAAGISRKDTLLWNIIPWYIGENGKIRSVMRSDFDQAEPYLEKLLKLLSKLKVIVLVGRKAQTKQELIKKLSEAEICEMWHPSNRVKHGSPTKWNEIPIQLKRVSKALAK